MKTTMYFDSLEDMRAYFVSGKVGNQYLVYIKDTNNNYVMYTSTNNYGISGEIGGYIDSPEEKEQKEEELDLSEDILNGTENPE